MGAHDNGDSFGTEVRVAPSLAATNNAETDKVIANGRTDRLDRVLLPFWTSVHARKQLKYIAFDEDKTQQALLTEALNMLFASREKAIIG